MTSPPPPHESDELVKEQLLAITRDLRETLLEERARRRELEDALDRLERSYLATIETLALVVEAKDAYTKRHLERTRDYAVGLSRRIEPAIAEDPVLRYGFLLHDVGKVGVRESILGKPGPLTDDEWREMRDHPLIGVQIVSAMDFLQPAVSVIKHHHERWDGKGYPDGLAGEDIPLAARIFSVADTLDAMVTDRPYRNGLDFDVAVEEIHRCAGTQFDPLVVEHFMDYAEVIRGQIESVDSPARG